MRPQLITLYLVTVAVLGRVSAEARTLVIDARHSTVGFKVRIFGGLTSVDGRFTKFEGTIQNYADDMSEASVRLVVQTESIDTGNENRDEHLRSEDFFDVQRYKTIEFESDGVFKRSDNYVVQGRLDMRGVERRIEIPFHRTHRAPVIWLSGRPTTAFEGEIVLRRSDYGIEATPSWVRVIPSTGELAMSDEVTVVLRIVAEGSPVHDELFRVYSERGASAAIREYEVYKQKLGHDPEAVGEFTLNRLAYRALNVDVGAAISLFELYAREYPESANAFDSLGEAYLRAGRKRDAADSYRKSLELDPNNANAEKMLRDLE